MSDIDSMLLLYISYLFFLSRSIHATLKSEYRTGLIPFRSFYDHDLGKCCIIDD